jgi:hypothetical protein
MAFKSDDGVKVRKVLLSLDEETIEVFRSVGGGNVSLGARMVAKGRPRKKVQKSLEERCDEHFEKLGVKPSLVARRRWMHDNAD